MQDKWLALLTYKPTVSSIWDVMLMLCIVLLFIAAEILFKKLQYGYESAFLDFPWQPPERECSVEDTHPI